MAAPPYLRLKLRPFSTRVNSPNGVSGIVIANDCYERTEGRKDVDAPRYDGTETELVRLLEASARSGRASSA
jgi:hypothetical protein